MMFAKVFFWKRRRIAGSPAYNDNVRRGLDQSFAGAPIIWSVTHHAKRSESGQSSPADHIIASLVTIGFDVHEAPDGRLILTHNSAIDPDSFDGITADLSGWLSVHGWDYEGWDCQAPYFDQAA